MQQEGERVEKRQNGPTSPDGPHEQHHEYTLVRRKISLWTQR